MTERIPSWFKALARETGVSEANVSKSYDKMLKCAGKHGERLAKEEWQRKGYRMDRVSQKKGGCDYIATKVIPTLASGGPDKLHIEVKINKSKQTPHQIEIQKKIEKEGGVYKKVKYIVPLIRGHIIPC